MGFWRLFFWSVRDPGRRGERAAARYLRGRGYRILLRNVRLATGEIDLIAQAPDGRTIVIVEVKAACVAGVSSGGAGRAAEGGDGRIYPEAHVNFAKRRKLISLASQAVKRYRWGDRPVRFDVVGVDLPPRGRAVVRHHVGAFESHV